MMRKSILITGCSSGFGRATALDLVRRGWRVFATVRKDADAASLLAEVELHSARSNITPLICDITQDEQIAALRQQVETLLRAELPDESGERMPGLNALLNNAGTAYAGPIELMSLEDIRAQFEINVIAHIAVTQAFLPLLKVARGTIINVSSISGRISVPLTGIYSSSKYALEGMSDALSLELAPFGVRVVLIEPASSPTSIWKTSIERSFAHLGELKEQGAYARLLKYGERVGTQAEKSGFPVQKFVDVVVRVLESSHPHARYGVPLSASALMLLRRLLPDGLWNRLIRLYLRW